MKKMVFLFFILGLFSCPTSVRRIDSQPVLVKSLLAVYMAASNNLESEGLADLQEMLDAYTQSDCEGSIVVLFDRITSGDDGFKDWDDTRLYQISRVGAGATITELSSIELGVTTDYIDEELNMGDGKVLEQFLKFIKKHYTAENYYLDIWNHGGGWFTPPESEGSRAIAFDEESDDELSLIELNNALKEAELYQDIILMDACNMACLETAAACMGLTQTLIFSQRTVPGTGFPYEEFIPALFSNENLVDKSKHLVALYGEYYKDNNVSLSAFKIDLDSGMGKTIADFSSRLAGISISSIREKREMAEEFSSMTVDIGTVITDPIQLLAVLQSSRIAVFPNELSGVSVYFPKYYYYDLYSSYFEKQNPSLLNRCNYLSFVQDYNHSGKENIDPHEPDGSMEDAQYLGIGDTETSYIWCPADKDWYRCSREQGKGFEVTLNPPLNTDYDLKVVWFKNGKEQVKIGNGMSGAEVFNITPEELGSALEVRILVYPAFRSYNQDFPYQLKVLEIE